MLDLIKDVDTLSSIQLTVKALSYCDKAEDRNERYTIRCRRFNQANTGKEVIRIEVEEP